MYFNLVKYKGNKNIYIMLLKLGGKADLKHNFIDNLANKKTNKKTTG